MENGDALNNEEIWDVLPVQEQRSIWRETEQAFWPRWRKSHEEWLAQHEQKVNRQTTELRIELSKLTGARDHLAETHKRLTHELLKVEQDLKRVNDDADAKSNQLVLLDQEQREELAEHIANHDSHSQKMRLFFSEKLGTPIEDDEVTISVASEPADAIDAMEGVEPTTQPSPEPMAEPQAGSTPPPRGEQLVDVIDADGRLIGSVERIDPWNQWIEAILKYPILRKVEIRRGRRFNEDHLASIYDRSEGKGVKWLSCLIQATGRIQSRRCQSCEKHQGAFEKCVIVGGRLLHKCGNCEWNRQGCHGASGEGIEEPEPTALPASVEGVGESETENVEQGRRELETAERLKLDRLGHEQPVEIPEATPISQQQQPNGEKPQEVQQHKEQEKSHEAPPEKQREEPQETRPDPQPEIQPRLVVEAETVARSAWTPIRDNGWRPVLQAPTGITPSTGPTRPSMGLSLPGLSSNQQRKEYGGRLVAPSTHESTYPGPTGFTAANTTGSFTPANSRSRPPSRQSSREEFLTPTAGSIEPSPQPTFEDNLEEITSENLIVRNNGEVYTFPECMEGVPLVKVGPGHPYWESDWKDLPPFVEAARTRWAAKLKEIRADDSQKQNGPMKYQIGRQLNRGSTIMEFLESGPISPYQLLSKKYMHAAKGGITSYDTLFRLCETTAELSKFKLDVPPIDWIRHRLWELSLSQGKDFNVARVVHDFYHDPKLKALRTKHGFKNIGRPSGGMRKPARLSTATNGDTPTNPRKRKGSQVSDTPPSETRVSLGEPLPASPGDISLQLPKRQRPIFTEAMDIFATDQFSDTDSVSGSRIFSEEFRLYQVKHRMHASSYKSSQYWVWQPHRRQLTHQVLKSTRPTEWGPFMKPLDFSFNLDEVTEITWNLQTLRIHIKVNSASKDALILRGVDDMPRGDILAWFKRERTMKRFLALCRTEKVSLVRETT